MTVALKEAARENFRQCAKLEAHEARRGFVASNVFSIAQSKVEPAFTTRAVYDGDESLGLVGTGEVSHGEGVMRLRFEE